MQKIIIRFIQWGSLSLTARNLAGALVVTHSWDAQALWVTHTVPVLRIASLTEWSKVWTELDLTSTVLPSPSWDLPRAGSLQREKERGGCRSIFLPFMCPTPHLATQVVSHRAVRGGEADCGESRGSGWQMLPWAGIPLPGPGLRLKLILSTVDMVLCSGVHLWLLPRPLDFLHSQQLLVLRLPGSPAVQDRNDPAPALCPTWNLCALSPGTETRGASAGPPVLPPGLPRLLH